MNFSEAKAKTLSRKKEKKLSTFLLAILTAAAFFVPYMITSEGYFTFFGDFNVQQIPFYQMCHAAIRSGNFKWNWLTDLGANFVGSYSFYLLGSPFFWLTLPFPNEFVPYLMGPLLILKFGCAALTAYLYIRRFTRTPEAAQIGGLIYAFSGFSVYNIFFNHFHEAIICFPLLLFATELLLTENRRGVFALCVALSALVNYFFFFGMAVFTVIYFFVRLGTDAIKFKFSRFLALVFEAVLGVAAAAVLLLPSVLAILENSRVSNFLLGWNAITYGKEQIYLNIIECFFFPPDLPARPVFFPSADVKWSSLGGWLPLFSMVGVFALFKNREKSWIKRIIGICTFMALVPILNSAFYALNSAYYARWFYMPILIMSLATAVMTEDRTADWSSALKWVAGITAGFALTIGFFPQQDGEGGLIFGLYTQSKDNTYMYRFWIAVAISAVCLVLLWLILKLRKHNKTAFFRTAVACVCVISIIYANVFIAFGRSHSYKIKDVVIDQLIEGNVELDGDEPFRIDVYDGVDNTGMYLGYPCINAFHSIVPASIMEFYDYVGVERSVGSRPETDCPALRPLLSVKYLINRNGGDSFINQNNEPLMTGYEYVKTSGGYYVYENKNYIPFGFCYDYYMSSDFCEEYSEESRSRMMLKAILLSDEQIKKYGSLMTDIKTLENSNFYFDEEMSETTLDTSDKAMAFDCEKLKNSAANSFTTDNDGFTATVTRDKKSLVFFSVPYDKGWSATVNGKPVDIERVNVGFMAVAVEAGESTIRFDYNTPGLLLGAEISGAAILILLVYSIIANAVIKKRRPENVYPEGNELLASWHKDDIAEAAEEQEWLFEKGLPEDEDFDDDEFDIFEDQYELNDKPNPSKDIPNISGKLSGGFKVDPNAFGDND